MARGAALAALARYGAAAAVPTLTEALADQDWAVRRRAARPPGGAGRRRARLRPRSGRRRAARPAEAYGAASLVAPAVSPHVFIETERGSVEIELDVRRRAAHLGQLRSLARPGSSTALPCTASCRASSCREAIRAATERAARATRSATSSTRRRTCVARSAWRSTGRTRAAVSSSSRLGPQPHLDGRYTAFGRVVAGMDVVDRLQAWDVIRRVWVWDGVKVTGH